ncbi:MAG: magnesium transporter MgtE N-terminal domain-containing protein [Hydrogenobaculum sp.]
MYQNAESQINQAINQDQQNLNMLLDKKLQKLEQQKKELQVFIKKQEELQKLEKKKQEEAKKKKQQEEQEIQKYVKVVAAADSDQAGAMLNDVEPEIAAKILVMLPSRKAGSILSAMDPKKAALVIDYIMNHKKELNAMKKRDYEHQKPTSKPTYALCFIKSKPTPKLSTTSTGIIYENLR